MLIYGHTHSSQVMDNCGPMDLIQMRHICKPLSTLTLSRRTRAPLVVGRVLYGFHLEWWNIPYRRTCSPSRYRLTKRHLQSSGTWNCGTWKKGPPRRSSFGCACHVSIPVAWRWRGFELMPHLDHLLCRYTQVHRLLNQSPEHRPASWARSHRLMIWEVAHDPLLTTTVRTRNKSILIPMGFDPGGPLQFYYN